jgi:hypothetical protein
MNAATSEWPLIFFPDAVVGLIILGALVLTGLGAVTLLWLLWKDRRNKQIW